MEASLQWVGKLPQPGEGESLSPLILDRDTAGALPLHNHPADEVNKPVSRFAQKQIVPPWPFKAVSTAVGVMEVVATTTTNG